MEWRRTGEGLKGEGLKGEGLEGEGLGEGEGGSHTTCT